MIADQKANEWGEVMVVVGEYMNTARQVPGELQKAKDAFLFSCRQYNQLVIKSKKQHKMKEVIEKLNADRELHRKEITKLDKAIEALQAVCVHEMVFHSTDRHKDYFECAICGKETHN